MLPLPATSSTFASASSSWLSLAIRLTVYLGSCTQLHVTVSLPFLSLLFSSCLVTSVCPSVSLSVCVSRCLPYAASCLRMHVAFSGGRACTDRCIDMPKRWLFLFLAGLQFARTVGWECGKICWNNIVNCKIKKKINMILFISIWINYCEYLIDWINFNDWDK